MRLGNDSPSFTPVHSQIRAIGPRDLHLWKGRGPSRTELQVPKQRGHTQGATGTPRPCAPTIELLQSPVGEINGLSADGVKAHGRCRNACPW